MREQEPIDRDELLFAYQRERQARLRTEVVFLQKNRELYQLNQQLEQAHAELLNHQRAAIQNEKLVALGILTAGVAHEINNPLAYVMSNVEGLRQYIGVMADMLQQMSELGSICNADKQQITQRLTSKFPRLSLAKLAEDSGVMLADIDDGLIRIKKIVTSLKMYSNQDDTSRREHNVGTSIDSALAILASEIKKNCTLELDLLPVPSIYCNANALTQIIINLLTNAMQALRSSADGVIAVRCFQLSDHVVICISDNGCGMDESVRQHIFDPFYTTKPTGVGTGLGLSICLSKIQDLGGRIEVDSTPDVGSCFTLYLPIDPLHSSRND